MSVCFIRILLLCSVAFALPAHALRVDIDAPDSLKLLLEQHLETSRAARLGEQPDEAEVRRLQAQSEETARELLATEGYFSPQVESTVQADGDDWRVRYRIVPGVQTTVRTLNLEFAGAMTERDNAAARQARLERNFLLQPGTPFRQADWNAAKLAVLRPLLAGPYQAARLVSSAARVDPAAHAADLTLVLDSGPAFYYGAPVISRHARYPASVAMNLNPTRPGQPFRQQDLLDYQSALESSGYFAQAVVRIDPDPALAAAVPIQVEVIERPEKLFSLGAGVSTDTGARVQATWLHRNVLDRGLQLKLDARIETTQQLAAAELAWPRNAKGYDYSVGLQLKREDLEGQETRSSLLGVKRHRTRGAIDTTLALQYQTETQQVGQLVDARNQALSLNYAWTYRTVGRAFYPRQGYVLALQAGGASEALLSDTSFLRLLGRHTQYFRLGTKGRLVLRGELGSVLADTRDGIPTDFLFRAGGDNSVRGYAYQSLGRTQGGGVASVRHLATASVEYNYFFTRDWGAAVFVDAGDAADTLDDLSLVYGYGVGARYRSPIGPVNLDLAYGEATEDVRVHFSLGVTF